MIEVENLTKRYGNFVAIEGVTFNVCEGEVVGFLGPNAAGKTTTMRIITCFMPATDGVAKVAGYDVSKDPMEVRKRIGYLPENVPLYTEMTVRSYLDFMAKIRGVSSSERKKRVDEVIEACGLERFSNRIIGKLSKGYRQRVGLAQSLVHKPPVLILDEPTIGLDPRQIIEIRNLIKNLGGEHTVILSTHILPEASMICSRIIIINEGKIAGTVTLRDGKVMIIESNLTGETKNLEESASINLKISGPTDAILNELGSLPNVIGVSLKGQENGVGNYIVSHEPGIDIRSKLASTIVNNGWGLLELKLEEITLEQAFLDLIREPTIPKEMLEEGEENDEIGSDKADMDGETAVMEDSQGIED